MAPLPELDEDEDDGAYDDADGVGDGLDEDADDGAEDDADGVVERPLSRRRRTRSGS